MAVSEATTMISVGEAAAIIGVTQGRVRQWLLEERFPHAKKFGGHMWQIPLEEAQNFVRRPSGHPFGSDPNSRARRRQRKTQAQD